MQGEDLDPEFFRTCMSRLRLIFSHLYRQESEIGRPESSPRRRDTPINQSVSSKSRIERGWDDDYSRSESEDGSEAEQEDEEPSDEMALSGSGSGTSSGTGSGSGVGMKYRKAQVEPEIRERIRKIRREDSWSGDFGITRRMQRTATFRRASKWVCQQDQKVRRMVKGSQHLPGDHQDVDHSESIIHSEYVQSTPFHIWIDVHSSALLAPTDYTVWAYMTRITCATTGYSVMFGSDGYDDQVRAQSIYQWRRMIQEKSFPLQRTCKTQGTLFPVASDQNGTTSASGIGMGSGGLPADTENITERSNFDESLHQIGARIRLPTIEVGDVDVGLEPEDVITPIDDVEATEVRDVLPDLSVIAPEVGLTDDTPLRVQDSEAMEVRDVSLDQGDLEMETGGSTSVTLVPEPIVQRSM